MKLVLQLGVALMVFISSGMAAAADWVALPGAGSADQYAYDRSKLTFKDDAITYWKKVVFKTPQDVHGKVAASGLLRERLDCAEHTAKLVSYLYYSATGETIEYVAQDDSETLPVIPDTVGDAFERVLCPLVWHKQEEARIKAEQKAAAAELAASIREAKKPESKPEMKPETKPDPKLEIREVAPMPAPVVPAATISPSGEIVIEKPAAKPAVTPLPMPRISDKLY